MCDKNASTSRQRLHVACLLKVYLETSHVLTHQEEAHKHQYSEWQLVVVKQRAGDVAIEDGCEVCREAVKALWPAVGPHAGDKGITEQCQKPLQPKLVEAANVGEVRQNKEEGNDAGDKQLCIGVVGYREEEVHAQGFDR